jgi:hypothetical protein
MLIILYDLYAPRLALLKRRVKLLTTWGLRTTGNLLFHLLLLWKDSSDHGSYMRCYAYVINLIKLYTRTKGNSANTDATIMYNIFLDRSQNYESKETSFIIFGALNKEL